MNRRSDSLQSRIYLKMCRRHVVHNDADPKGLPSCFMAIAKLFLLQIITPQLSFRWRNTWGTDPENVRVLTARSPESALEMAKEYQPNIALVASSFVEVGAMLSLPDLVKDVSPHTQIIIAKDGSGAAAQ